MEFVKDITEAWAQRVKSPILGSVAISVVVINWKSFWFLFFAKADVLKKFEFFDSSTNTLTLFWYPLLVGLGLALALPWIQLGGAVLARRPVESLRRHQSDVLHEQRIYQLNHQIREEELRAQLDKTREEAKIAAAERLERAQEINKNLAEDIIDDRQATSTDTTDPSLFQEERDLLCIVAKYGNGFVGTFEIEEGFRFVAGDIEFIIPHRRLLELNASLEKFRKLDYLREFENELTLSGYKLADDITLRSDITQEARRKRFIEYFAS
ncbi:hypothetical protein DL239_14515 [Sedimentitalea sp. CY04]|uniref:Uncharacterized protein n=1 Tax=Parasedimentitalea denitrificans TaxID=2211118 RepID=A0ABX0WD96_9RHOB|nr:hypothetical protein [Sedimentitalea sp. CY04]NIZ62191.1 hypothetical protein [Sedimentitalea sp. CY04]